jgi:hypothetical protein
VQSAGPSCPSLETPCLPSYLTPNRLASELKDRIQRAIDVVVAGGALALAGADTARSGPSFWCGRYSLWVQAQSLDLISEEH